MGKSVAIPAKSVDGRTTTNGHRDTQPALYWSTRRAPS